jgi:hypothetical protein
MEVEKDKTISQKLSIDKAKSEIGATKAKHRPSICHVVKEPFFLRRSAWRFFGRNRFKLFKLMNIATSFGLMEYWYRFNRLIKYDLENEEFIAAQNLKNAFISLNSGIFTVFIMCGGFLIFCSVVFIAEILFYYGTMCGNQTRKY